MRDAGKIPVTVLTGFLGSGKTTLVNHILTADHGQRIAVIENEFGEIPIDGALVLGGPEKIIEMSNGCCLCCTARTDLIEILHSLLERPERFDRILIETSGLADPNPVAQTFFVDDEIASQFTLDAIVTLVDAKHIGAHLDDAVHDGAGTVAIDQVAFADRLVVNKVDLTGPDELHAVRQRLRRINATADILTSSYAAVDLADILGVAAFDLSRTITVDPGWLEDDTHLHDPSLTAVGIEFAGDLDRRLFEAWLASFVTQRGDDVYRFKGLIAVDDDDRRLVLQGVHRMFDLRPGAAWRRDQRRSKIVFIGRNLDRDELTQSLQSCLTRP